MWIFPGLFTILWQQSECLCVLNKTYEAVNLDLRKHRFLMCHRPNAIIISFTRIGEFCAVQTIKGHSVSLFSFEGCGVISATTAMKPELRVCYRSALQEWIRRSESSHRGGKFLQSVLFLQTAPALFWLHHVKRHSLRHTGQKEYCFALLNVASASWAWRSSHGISCWAVKDDPKNRDREKHGKTQVISG